MTISTINPAETARQSLTQQLISRVDRNDADKPFGLYFIGSSSDFAPLPRFVERSVFLKRFGNDDHEMDREYGPYESSSFFITVIDHRRAEPVGVIRVIENSEAGLKTLIDIEREPRWGTTTQDFLERHCDGDDLSKVLDVATLAVRGGWSATRAGSMVGVALYGGLFRSVLATRANRVVAAIDESVANLLRSVDLPIEPVCDLPAIDYLGSAETKPYLIQFNTVDQILPRSPTLMGVLMGGMIDKDFSLPAIDLDNPNPHPTELEPQFIEDPAPART